MAQERDDDLQAFYDAADRVGPDGVRALVDKLQSYRRLARNVTDNSDALMTNMDMVSNVAMLRAKLENINQSLQQWRWELDLDTLEVSDFTNAV
jgi:hypothetical protein